MQRGNAECAVSSERYIPHPLRNPCQKAKRTNYVRRNQSHTLRIDSPNEPWRNAKTMAESWCHKLVGTRDPAIDNSHRARLLLQELWRQRLEFARLQLEAAKDHVEAAKEFHSQAPSPDEARAFRRALQAERWALVRYRRALRIFTDLVVDGKIPDER